MSERTPYDYAVFLADLRDKKLSATYAELAQEYGVNQYYLWYMLNREDYHPPARVCRKLNIRYYVQTLPCPTCGEVHPCDCGSQRVTRLPGSGPHRSPRIAVSKVDPRAAAKSLTDNLPQDVLQEMVHILANEVAPEWY